MPANFIVPPHDVTMLVDDRIGGRGSELSRNSQTNKRRKGAAHAPKSADDEADEDNESIHCTHRCLHE